MSWPDQDPPAIDVILHVNVPCAGTGPDQLTYLEIDKLSDGRYRATVGTLFEFQEVCRTGDLEALVRHANAMAGCRSFDDVVLDARPRGLDPHPKAYAQAAREHGVYSFTAQAAGAHRFGAIDGALDPRLS